MKLLVVTRLSLSGPRPVPGRSTREKARTHSRIEHSTKGVTAATGDRSRSDRFVNPSQRLCALNLVAMLAGCLLAMCLSPMLRAAAGDGQLPVLEFLPPTNNALLSTLDGIPIVLR